MCILTLSPHKAVYIPASQKHLNSSHIYVKKQVVATNLQNPDAAHRQTNNPPLPLKIHCQIFFS